MMPRLCKECGFPVLPEDRTESRGPLPQRHRECKLFRDQKHAWTRAVRKYKKREFFRV